MIYLLFLKSYRNAENKRNRDLNSWTRFQNRDKWNRILGKEIKMIKYLFIVTKKNKKMQRFFYKKKNFKHFNFVYGVGDEEGEINRF